MLHPGQAFGNRSPRTNSGAVATGVSEVGAFANTKADLERMATWIPMFALPNIALEEAIEADGVALVSFQDERLRQLANDHRRFGSYLDRFRTEFGCRLQPSIIIRRDDSSENYRSVEALAGFRDALSISVIPHSWATLLRHGHNPEILYSDWFDIYPWMLDKDYNFVVMNSMAQMGFEQEEKLHPQSTPGITPSSLTRRMIDRPMLEALLKRWPTRYQTKTPSWENTALFRSLNMANAASKIPANAEGTHYDIGRSIGLWVSAFEILVHTGKRSDIYKVYDMFDKVEWHLTECKKKNHEPYGLAGKPLRTLACWVYGQIHAGRNRFLHGNSITADTLMVAKSGRPLLHYAPILYRMALTGFLKLKWEDEPEPTRQEEMDAYQSRKFDVAHFQGEMEAALATALYSQEEYTAIREARAVRLRPVLTR